MKQFRYAENGFALVELLVVITILGFLISVLVPNFAQIMGRGKTEAYAAELQNVQNAVTALIAESTASQLDAAVATTDDMDTVTANSGALLLSSYLTGLDADGKVSTGCTYAFTKYGTVTQTTP